MNSRVSPYHPSLQGSSAVSASIDWIPAAHWPAASAVDRVARSQKQFSNERRAPAWFGLYMGWQVLPSHGVQMGPDWHGLLLLRDLKRHKPGAAAMGKEEGIISQNIIRFIRIPIQQPVYPIGSPYMDGMGIVMESNSFFIFFFVALLKTPTW